MPISYDLSDDLLQVVASGAYTFAEIKSTFGTAIRAIPLDRSIATLVDARLSEHNPSGEELRSIASFAGSLLPRIGRRVALVVSAEVRFGLGRMLEVFGEPEGVEFKVFRNLDDARSWLVAIA